MKISIWRRSCALLLALMVLSAVAPSALAEDAAGELQDFKLTGPIGDARLKARTDGAGKEVGYDIVMEESEDTYQISVSVEPDNEANRALHVTWKSSDDSVLLAQSHTDSNNGHTGTLTPRSPGEATVTVAAGEGDHRIEKKIDVDVSGIKLSGELAAGIKIQENGRPREIKLGEDYTLWGNAASENASMTVSVVNSKNNVNIVHGGGTSGFTIEGVLEGDAIVEMEISAAGNIYKERINIEVTPNIKVIEWTTPVSPANPLRFSELMSRITAACQEVTGAALDSIVNLRVSSEEGILYLGYRSPDEPGAGAGSGITYYASRSPAIKDLTFVPNPSFAGEKAVITFTGQTASVDGKQPRSFKGRIEVTITDAKTDLTVSTRRNTPLPLTAAMFSQVCQEQVGSPLGYVVFTLPPASQGTLYVDYKDEWNYAARVSSTEQYDQPAINTITFVPAEAYVGDVRIGYAGYSVSGSKYNGELVIQVKQGLDDAVTYNDKGAGSVSFDRKTFDSFCENATGKALSKISFTLPSAAQGVLYLNWTGSRGTAVKEGEEYTAAQVDRMTFVAAGGFNGVVRIPFSGTARSGLTFTGTVEIHIQSTGTGTGDITYICAPSQSVKLSLSDFANLCQDLTGQRLHYISFQSLPDFNQGSLYHNRTSAGVMGTRATTATRYFNSAAPYIANLSFWAASGFTGVEIPFTGSSVNGQTFTGILAINTGAGAGSGQAGTVNYSTTGQTPVAFSGGDFDAACRQATNAALSYLQFSLPSSGQGILYYDYRAGTAPTSLNPGTTLYRSGETSVDRVSFVASKGFSGMATVPFTGWAIDGRQFQGTVQISVRPDAALGGLVRYESRGEPVHINAYDIQLASGGAPASLRFTGLPDASQGKLYYQYAGPTRYSWTGNTSTIYSLYGDPSVSNLTFVPKAGFYGVVDVPYTATNGDGTQYAGTIRFTMTEPSTSANFDDLSGYSAQMKSAVDYLYTLGVVKGTGQRNYAPGASIRRGDFCVMLSRAFQFNVGSSVQGFSDVAPDAYYAQAVNEMYALGVVNGVGGGRFDPSSSVSRQDAALMVQRALNQAGISVPNGNAAALAAYGDRDQVADYAQGAVAGLTQLGLLPTSGSSLSPRSDLNRGDMALLLHRAMTQ